MTISILWVTISILWVKHDTEKMILISGVNNGDFWTLKFVLTVLLKELTFRGLGMKKGRKPGKNSPKNEMSKATRSSPDHIASSTKIWNQKSRPGQISIVRLRSRQRLRSDEGKIDNMTIMMIMKP